MKKIIKLLFVYSLCVFYIVLPVSASVIGIPEENELIYIPSTTPSEENESISYRFDDSVTLASNVNDAIDAYNQEVKYALLSAGEYSETYIDTYLQFSSSDINEAIYYKYGILVKGTSLPNGEPDCSSKPSLDSLQTQDADGDWRFLGQNINNEWVENPFYDPSANADIDKRDWLYWNSYIPISNSIIGAAIENDGIYCHQSIVEKYYPNFVYGMSTDYYSVLSSDWWNEFDTAKADYTDDFINGAFDTTNLEDGYHHFDNIGTPGTTYPPIGNTDMGSYIRIVSLPTEHSAGVAYLFHEAPSGAIYYLSVLLMDNNIQVIDNTAISTINADSTISDTDTSTSGTYDFSFASVNEQWTSYEITSVSEGVTIDTADMVGNISSGYTYTGSVPITIEVPGTSRTISLEITGTTEYGNTVTDTATHTVTKSFTGTSYASSSMTASNAGVLRSDTRGTEEFDVTQGIPSGEDLYANVFTKEYLVEEVYTPVTGTKDYTVIVSKSYDYKWWDTTDTRIDTDGDGVNDDWEGGWDNDNDDPPVSKSYTVTRSYAYYLIDQLEVYSLGDATLSNSVLPVGTLTLSPTGYNPPTASASHSDLESDHITDATFIPPSVLGGDFEAVSFDVGTNTFHITLKSETVGGTRSTRSKPSTPDEDFSSYANQALTEIQVRNDAVTFNGTTIMDDQWYDTLTPAPGSIPSAPTTNENVFYKNGLTIPATHANGVFSTAGSVDYHRVVSVNSAYGAVIQEDLASTNDVTVHTPVVCYATIDNLYNVSQAVSPNTSLSQLIIGESFQVHFPTNGQHRNIPGYGNRDYSSTTANRQVLFQFDSYLGDDDSGTFYPSGTWINLTTDDTTFYIPNWVSEHQSIGVGFRALPINLQSSSDAYETNYNDDLNEYKAIAQASVQLIPRVYDFTIDWTNDSNWTDHFNQSSTSTFYVGTNDDRGNSDSTHHYQLPIMPNKNGISAYNDYALKLGNTFHFSLTTNGDMTGGDDVLYIKPTYWHVNADGTNRQEVDVYYTEASGFVGFGSEGDSLGNWMVLNSTERMILTSALEDTAKVLDSQSRSNGYSYSHYLEMLTGSYSHNIAYDGNLVLTELQKTYIGDATNRPSGYSDATILSGEQQWYGEFFLPNSALFVPKGTDLSSYSQLTVSSAPFLQDGYIIVNFQIGAYHNISTLSDLATASPTILYETSRGNQWAKEGFDQTQDGMTLMEGDIAFYHVDLSVGDLYK